MLNYLSYAGFALGLGIGLIVRDNYTLSMAEKMDMLS